MNAPGNPPPPIYGQPQYGQPSTPNDPAALERELSGLSWPGFLLGWIWAVGNSVWIGLLGLIPIVNIVMAFVLLFKGRRWAWEKGSWRDLDHFVRVQRQWLIASLIIVPIVAIGIGGIMSAMAIYGFRKFTMNAKRAEAMAALTSIGQGLSECAQTEGLPPSTQPVPAEVPRGERTSSSPVNWSQPAFECAGFRMIEPPFYQYSWEQKGADSGVIWAQADLDGDGVVEQRLELPITCAAGSCTVGTIAIQGE